MKTKPFFLIVLLWIFLSLACNFPLTELVATPTPPPTSTPTETFTPLPTLTPTETPTSTPSPTPTQTFTPTVTPTDTPTPTQAPTTSPQKFALFEEIWKTVKEQYIYEDYNGVNWLAVYQEFFARLSLGVSPKDFYQAMKEMIDRLKDDHSVYFSPREVEEQLMVYEGEKNYVGIGVFTVPVIEKRYITVILPFRDSPAERAGIQAHDRILAVNGQPIIDEEGNVLDLLSGEEGTYVTLTVQTPGGEPRYVSLRRERVDASIPIPYHVFSTPGGKRIGYLLVVSFADSNVDERVGKAMKKMTADAPLDGLIIDLRANQGGEYTTASNFLSYFTSGKLGYFTNRYGKKRRWSVSPKNVGGSQSLPLVVFVGDYTVSFGEMVAGVLQDRGRAYLIGEITEGNVELLWGYPFKDGSVLFLAHERFVPANRPEQDWEATGIIPDLVVPTDWDEITLTQDLALEVAFVYFDTH
ncbi:MAG: S41 family peptidase [Anaerolineales bacterium]|nr:S41 family peptidase [Anaerolineales bacterium]